MFELTISTNKAKYKDIDFIFSLLKNKIKSAKGVIVSEEIDGRAKLAFAVPDDKKDYALSLAFDAISEAIIRDYKYEFLKRNLSLQTGNKIAESAFIKALSVYDKTSDKEFIKKCLKPSLEILIDSFYSFRLWELEKRWKNIADLMSENCAYICMSGSFSDLMKFLVMSNECEAGEVHICKGDGNIFCGDSSGKEFFNVIYEEGDNFVINILSELISLSPEKIIIHKELENTLVANEILNVFDGRVRVIKK